MKPKILIFAMLIATSSASAKEYNVKDFGAVSDTTVLSTVALQTAIDRCSQDGGGVVVVPEGIYKTGTLVLKSNVNLHLEEGATIYGSTQLADYKKLKPEYVSLRTQTETIQLIYADKAVNVKITGKGTIDGRGRVFPKLTWDDEGITRPHLLRFIECRNVEVAGISLRNSGCWMQHYLACDSVSIHDLNVYNRNNYNNDALDLDGCHYVDVRNLVADSDDDGITLKSTSPRLCEHINIQNCTVSSHCNAVKLGTESNGGFRDINISNISVRPSQDQSSKYFGLSHGIGGICLEMVDGGTLENVALTNIDIQGTESPIFIRLGNRARGYYKGQKITNVGTLHNAILQNINIHTDGNAGCSITGLPGHPVENILLRNVIMRQKGGIGKTEVPTDEKPKEYPEATMWGNLPAKGFFLRHARNVKFENVIITTDQPDERPDYVKVDYQD